MAGWECPALPARWGQVQHPAFVGRQRETAALREAWGLAARGFRQVVFIGGQPGVGKSRFVAEMATALHSEHASVLLGGCVSALGAPYQPFVEPIAALTAGIEEGVLVVDARDADHRRAAGAGHLGSLRILTGVGPAATTMSHPDNGRAWSPAPAADHQFAPQLFEACVQVVIAAALVRPLVLVLEDMQWAGDSALGLLRYLVARTADCPLLILATQRTSVPDRSAGLVSTVAQLYRLDGVRRIDLEGLTTEDIADYLADVAGAGSRRDRGSAAVLRDLTGGNPFLLREVWRELDSLGGLSALRVMNLQTPESLRDTVAHRLSGLPTAHRRTVEVAAVIGEEFSIPLLAAVLAGAQGPSEAAARTFAGLDAATALGLLESVRGPEGGYRFPHGLARQAVLDTVGDFQRASDNAAVAAVLEGMPAADLRVQRLADHYAAAAVLGFADKAMRYLAEAAEAAQTGLAHGDAARLFERAAGVATTRAQRDDLRLKAARGYLRSSRFGQARELNELVAASAAGVDRLRAAIGYEAASWRSGRPGERPVELLTSALNGVTLQEHDALHIRAIAALGRAYSFTGDVGRAREFGQRATLLARETGDERLLAAVLQIGLQMAATPRGLTEKLASVTEIRELTERIRDLRHLGAASYHRAAICYIQGDPQELAAAHNDLSRMARVTGQQFWEWVDTCVTFGMHVMNAEFSAARRDIDNGQGFGRDFEPVHDTDGASALQNFIVRREIGGLDNVRQLISGEESVTDQWAPGLLALYCELGLRPPARRVLQHLLERELARHQASATWPFVLSVLAEAAVWLGDHAAAEQLHPLVMEYQGLNLLGGEFLAVVGSADRQIGAIESVLGWPTAAAHFAAALEMDGRMGSPLHVATTLATEVAHLRRVGDSPERLAQQSAAAHKLCAQYGLVRVQRMLDEAVPPHRSARGADGLTARETDVLRLLGGGMSNRRIARHLAISENTAANHVRSILMKTGSANRTQAALYASTHGLLPGAAVAERSERHRM
jgi:DNA-binding CsgD family transcriptional regulator